MKINTENANKELLRFREDNGITINKLVEKTGVSKPTIIGIEKGRLKPHVTTIFKLNEYLKTFK
jgi:DNA-binding XRE family transcriptional regulator